MLLKQNIITSKVQKKLQKLNAEEIKWIEMI